MLTLFITGYIGKNMIKGLEERRANYEIKI